MQICIICMQIDLNDLSVMTFEEHYKIIGMKNIIRISCMVLPKTHTDMLSIFNYFTVNVD